MGGGESTVYKHPKGKPIICRLKIVKTSLWHVDNILLNDFHFSVV